jgi:hypothetical protein
LFQVALHIALGDASTVACLDFAEIDGVFLGHAPGHRGRTFLGWRRFGLLGTARLFVCRHLFVRRRLARFLDRAQHVANLYRLTGLALDVRQDTILRGRHL